jgi:hypothetical protein
MQVSGSPEPDQIPRISPLSIRNSRLRFLENRELPAEIVNVIADRQLEDVSIKGQKFKRTKVLHQMKRLFRISTKVNIQGEAILISNRSIAKNTYATKHQIKAAKTAGHLGEFIALSMVQKKFESGTISREQMQNEVLETIRDRKFLNLSTIYQHRRNEPEILVGLNERGEIEVLRVGQPIAKGAFAKVTQIDNLSTGEAEVIKSGRKNMGISGRRDVENEFHKDEQIFGSRKPWGFRQRLTQLTTMNVKTKRAKDGLTHVTRDKKVSRTPRYESDYSKDIERNPNRTFENLLPDFYQMIYSLHYMESLRMTHGDIKPENFLVKVVDGVKLVHLADLGDTICFDQLNPDEELSVSTMGTAAFTIRKELFNFSRLLRGEKTPENLEEMERVQGKRDVFAMGATIYKALTDNYPYVPVRKGNGFYAPKEFTYVNIPNVPPAFNHLLEQMLDPNAETRISRSEAWTSLLHIVAEYPEIHQQILDDISKLGYDQTEV